MKTIRNLAWANTKYHRGKNILSGIAIILTTLLVYLILSIGVGTITVKNHVANELYPTHHTMYRGISEEKKDLLILHNDVESYGLRQDVGSSALDDGEILMSYFDEEALTFNKVELVEGAAPNLSNEIALSRAALTKLGFPDVNIGDPLTFPYQTYEDQGLSLEKTAEFQLSGLLPDPTTTNKNEPISMLVSQEFMTNTIPEDQRNYHVFIQVPTDDGTTTDRIQELSAEIAASFDIPEGEVIINTESLAANYIDPSLYTTVALITAIILITGALTIYSIYYVSLIKKVQEYGKLKALGATKRQIRLAVLLENLVVAFVAIPIGLLLSIACAEFVFKQVILNMSSDNTFITIVRESLDNNNVNLFIPWIALLTVGITLLTVLIASLKPMRFASKIMPAEAMRYTGLSATKQKLRKGFIDLNLKRLAEANLARNKKRTLITILSLSAIGILFITISTVLACVNPLQVAQSNIVEDFRIRIDDANIDQMHPEWEWTSIQQNNPLSEELINQIVNLPGVEEVFVHQKIDFTIPTLIDQDTGQPSISSLGGIDEIQFKEISQYFDPPISYEDFLASDNIIATHYIMLAFPEIQAGDQLACSIQDGDTTYTKTFTVAALANIPRGYSYTSDFLTSNATVEGLSSNNLNNYLDIRVADSELAAVDQQLTALVEQEETFVLESFQGFVEQWESFFKVTSGAGYGIMLILAIVGVMNLVNTTIDSILSRKKELGVMQALGMSTEQMHKMLREEGMFYAGGIILLSIGFGSLLGYFAYLYSAANGLFDIRTYNYPIAQAALLILLVVIVQLTLTLVTTNMVNKESVISRIQNSE